MAGHRSQLATVGRRDLDDLPEPTTPPEAQPRLAQMVPEGEQEEALTLGSLQQSGVIFQTGMAVEKSILTLANLLPGFEQVASQIIPLLRSGIAAGLRGMADQEGQSQLPQQGPLQQGPTL